MEPHEKGPNLSVLRAVALAYHGIDDVGGSVPVADDPHRLLTSVEHLRAHIRLLRRLGYRFATADDVIADRRPAGRVAVLSFDDGFVDWISHALPVLEQERAVGSFYVCPGWWEDRHPLVAGPPGRIMAARDVRRLVDAGMGVGSHAWDHPDLRGLDDATLAAQLDDSRRAVAEATGGPCRTLAYPYGLSDQRVRTAAAAAGYELAWGWQPGPWERYDAPRLPGPPRNGARRLGLKMLGIRKFWAA